MIRSKSPAFDTARSFATILGLATALLTLTPDLAHAQSILKEMVVQPAARPATGIPVFINNPEKAAVIVRSPIPNLRFDSNMGGLIDRSESGTGVYRLLVDPVVQNLSVQSVGFIQTSFRLSGLEPLAALYYTIEPATPDLTTGRGNLTLFSEPEGATLTIDGFTDFRFTTPHQFENYAAQAYSIRLEAPHHKPREAIIEIRDGESTTEFFELEPAYGYLRIEAVNQDALDAQSAPESFAGDPQALVATANSTGPNFRETDSFAAPTEFRVQADPQALLDGVGAPPEGHLTLRDGLQQITVTAQGFEPATIQVAIQPGQATTRTVGLRQRYGRLELRAVNSSGQPISGARILVPPQLQPTGLSSTATSVPILSGAHEIQLTAPGYQTQSVLVQIRPGRRLTGDVMLITPQEAALQPGTVRIVSEPLSTIYVDGRLAGTSTAEITRYPGPIDIRIEHPYRDVEERYQIRTSQFETLYLSPLPSRGGVRMAGIVPGLGHLISRRPRGWLYLVGTLAAAGYAYVQYAEYASLVDDTDRTYVTYMATTDEREIATLSNRLATQIADRDAAYDLALLSGAAAAGLYAVSLFDVALTRPRYGFRDPDGARLAAALLPGAPGLATASPRSSTRSTISRSPNPLSTAPGFQLGLRLTLPIPRSESASPSTSREVSQ